MNITRVLTLVVCLAGLSACRLSYKGGATTVGSAELSSNENLLVASPTPVVKQKTQADCGLAALAMVAGAWGHSWSVDDLARKLPPSKNGVKLKRLRDYARERGLEAYAVKGTFADLETELRAGRPVVLGLVLPYDRNNNLNHYEVAVAIDPRDHTVITRDPATGELMRRVKKVIDLEWKTAGYATLVVVSDRSRPKPASVASTGD
ncbi:MAG: cysteine peptidase family C39 domain-containing protein [Kofleriaceae bacterium]